MNGGGCFFTEIFLCPGAILHCTAERFALIRIAKDDKTEGEWRNLPEVFLLLFPLTCRGFFLLSRFLVLFFACV